MTLSIYTPVAAFAGDIADIARIFLGNVELFINAPGGALTLVHTENMDMGERVCTVTLGAFTSVRRETPRTDTLAEKRLHKRQVKLCAYDCFRALTKRTPPWGALTGVRPTRLLYAEMARGMSVTQAARAVSETFDIGDEKTALLEETVRTQSELPAPRERDVDVYIGIPFCVTRCAYCSFLSGEVGDGRRLLPYVTALEHEIAQAAALVAEAGLSPRAFYMGGGTPTALPAELLARVLRAARPLLARCREVTCEAGRPDTITREKLRVLAENSVTRVSVNPQTAHDRTLLRIGRAHTARQTEEAFSMAREAGFAHINMDVIAGLPGEDADMFSQTLAWIASFRPESLTVHALCVKRSSVFHLEHGELPENAVAEEMIRAGGACARAMRMRPYYLYRQKYAAGNLENVGYCLPGMECLYNVDMMEETANILALGAGGVSKRVRDAALRIERAPNVADIDNYIARVQEMADRKRALFLDEAKPPQRAQ